MFYVTNIQYLPLNPLKNCVVCHLIRHDMKFNIQMPPKCNVYKLMHAELCTISCMILTLLLLCSWVTIFRIIDIALDEFRGQSLLQIIRGSSQHFQFAHINHVPLVNDICRELELLNAEENIYLNGMWKTSGFN